MSGHFRYLENDKFKLGLVREWVKIEPGTGANVHPGRIQLGGETVATTDSSGDLRHAIERHLRRLAARQLPARVHELAASNQLSVRKVSVRNQRSRWGSCSRTGTISLNWRLVQAPPYVEDYVILHELTHLFHMNHSARFWAKLEQVCPDYRAAEKWLKQHGNLLS